ncbi:hypothetical protein ACMFMG_000101 [Clarireedia jacksonii]
MAAAVSKRSLSTDSNSKRCPSRYRYVQGKSPCRRSHSRSQSFRFQNERSVSRESSRRPVSRPPPPPPQNYSHPMSPMTINIPRIFIPSPSPPIEQFVLPVMERTQSGDSIISDEDIANLPRSLPHPTNHSMATISDADAAYLVLHRRLPQNYEELSSKLLDLLLYAPLTDDRIYSIISLTSVLFFHSSLLGRVRWSWSSPSQPRYSSELLGTTALRSASFGGFETLIVLSHPILKNPCYDRRLLLSTLLHELVHCYLFVKCGFAAKEMGGHTTGFHAIVEELGDWVECNGGKSKGWLRLCGMRGNLEIFRKTGRERDGDGPDRERAWEQERGRRYEMRPMPFEPEGERIPLRSLRENEEYRYASTVGGGYQRIILKHGHAGCSQSPGPEQEGGHWSGKGRMSEIGYPGIQEGFR